MNILSPTPVPVFIFKTVLGKITHLFCFYSKTFHVTPCMLMGTVSHSGSWEVPSRLSGFLRGLLTQRNPLILTLFSVLFLPHPHLTPLYVWKDVFDISYYCWKVLGPALWQCLLSIPLFQLPDLGCVFKMKK